MLGSASRKPKGSKSIVGSAMAGSASSGHGCLALVSGRDFVGGLMSLGSSAGSRADTVAGLSRGASEVDSNVGSSTLSAWGKEAGGVGADVWGG